MSRDLPPEAYTKETLQKAFDWLQEQPEPVKASIHTPERLVSLYQKSQRLNDSDAPVSSKKFITDLKNLATSLDQFDGGAPQVLESPAPTESKPQSLNEVMRYSPEVKVSSQPTPKPPIESLDKPKVASSPLDLDPVSLERLEKVRTRFNLGSQKEALRLIISLGFEKFTDIQ